MADTPEPVIDPVCGMYVDPARAAASRDLDGRSYFFCSERCAQKFDADAPAYLAAARGDDWRTWPGDELT